MNTFNEVKQEISDLLVRLAEVEATLNSLREVGADALISSTGVITFCGPEEPYRAFFIAMNEGGLTLDSNGRVLYSNPKFSQMTGISVDMVRGRLFTSFIIDEDQLRVIDFFAQRRADACEAGLLDKNGMNIPVRISLTPMDIAEKHLFCLVITDLTIQKRFVAQQQKLALLHELQRYEILLDTTGDGIYVLDIKGNMIQANKSFCNLLGYSLNEALTMNIAQWDVQWLSAEMKEKIQDVISNRKSATFETRHRRHDGSLIDVEINATGVLIDNQELLYCSMRDITARKKMEQQLAQDAKINFNLLTLSKVLIATTTHIKDISNITLTNARLLTNSEHGYVSFIEPETGDNVSYALTALMNENYVPSEEKIIILKRNPDGTYPQSWGHTLNTRQSFYTNQPLEHPVTKKIATGNILLHGFLSVPILIEERLVGQIVLANPIHPYTDSDMAVVEQIAVIYALALQRYYIEKELIITRDAAQASARAKSEFLANMSHEIRTPMNGIIGLTQLALGQSQSPKVRDYLEKINISSNSLLRILNDILDYSKIESGLLTIEERIFDLDDMLNTLRHLFMLHAEEKKLAFGIEVAANVPCQLVGDALRLQQVLANLLGNAIKFTEHGSVVLSVLFNGMEKSKVRLIFSVMDTGIGMNEAVVANLFHPFTQADATITRRFGGTGLGLSISHKLLHLLDSKFVVETTPGQGSIFSFEVCFNLAPEISGIISKPPVKSHQMKRWEPMAYTKILAGVHILVAEDNLINQQVVQELLQTLGIHVTTAINGHEVLALMEKEKFDAILMDIHMPEMDGLETTRQLRQDPRFHVLPIIALTAGVMADERERALICGMNGFLAKPIELESLIEALVSCIPMQSRVADPIQRKEIEPSIVKMDFLNEIAGLDIALGLKRINGNKDLYRRLLKEFLARNANDAEKIASARVAGNVEMMHYIVHTLKGIAGNIGATRLLNAAIAMEKALKARADHNYGALLQEIRYSLDEVSNGIKIFIENSEYEDSLILELPILDREILTVIFNNLAKELRKNSIDAIQTMDKKLIPLIKKYVSSENLRAFENSLQSFDFEKALLELERLGATLNITY